MASASGSATVSLRERQASRGRPIKVSTTGVAMMVPSVSPPHHVHHVVAICPAGTAPVSHSAALELLALSVQASAPPSANRRVTAIGRSSVNGHCAVRRTSQAPRPACNAAPRAIARANASAVSSLAVPWPRCKNSQPCTPRLPSATAGKARRPNTSAAASAMPAGGKSGDA